MPTGSNPDRGHFMNKPLRTMCSESNRRLRMHEFGMNVETVVAFTVHLDSGNDLALAWTT